MEYSFSVVVLNIFVVLMNISSIYNFVLKVRWNRKILLLVVGMFFKIMLISCKKTENKDQFPPTIKLISSVPYVSSAIVCGVNSNEVITLPKGQSITLVLEFTDDIALSQAKLDIHNNFDCHGHKSQKSGVIWNLIEIKQLEGIKQTITVNLQPPENVVTGNYHLGIMAVDMEGRTAQPIYFDIKLFDPDDMVEPIIQLNTPMPYETLPLNEEFIISGSVSDSVSLSNGSLELYIINSFNVSFTIVRIDFPENAGLTYDFSVSYTTPPFFQAGNHTLKLIAKDQANNEATLTRDIMFE